MKNILGAIIFALAFMSGDHALAQEDPCKGVDDMLIQNKWMSTGKNIHEYRRLKPLEGSLVIKKSSGEFLNSYYFLSSVNLGNSDKSTWRTACRILINLDSGECKGDSEVFFIEKLGRTLKFSTKIKGPEGDWSTLNSGSYAACEDLREHSSWSISPHR